MIPLDRTDVARPRKPWGKIRVTGRSPHDRAVMFRQGEPVDLEDMVAALAIFENSSRGQRHQNGS